MKNVISCGLTGIFIVALLLVPELSVAKTYSYTDENGVVHLTDRKKDIPDKYRDSTVKIVEKKRPVISSIVAKAKGLINKFIDFINTLNLNIFSLLIIISIAMIVSYMLARIFIERKLVRYVAILFSLAFLSLILLFLYLRNVANDNSGIRDSLNKTISLTAVHKKFYWNLMNQ
jgi:hypothetical protein